jgi:hypothetical protein
MISLEEFSKLKKQVDQAQREADEANGALKQLHLRLADEFDCQTEEAARKLLEKMERELEKDEKIYEKELVAYKKKMEGILT